MLASSPATTCSNGLAEVTLESLHIDLFRCHLYLPLPGLTVSLRDRYDASASDSQITFVRSCNTAQVEQRMYQSRSYR